MEGADSWQHISRAILTNACMTNDMCDTIDNKQNIERHFVVTVRTISGRTFDGMWVQELRDDGDIWLVDKPDNPMKSLYYLLRDDGLYFDHELRAAELIEEVADITVTGKRPAGGRQ